MCNFVNLAICQSDNFQTAMGERGHLYGVGIYGPVRLHVALCALSQSSVENIRLPGLPVAYRQPPPLSSDQKGRLINQNLFDGCGAASGQQQQTSRNHQYFFPYHVFGAILPMCVSSDTFDFSDKPVRLLLSYQSYQSYQRYFIEK